MKRVITLLLTVVAAFLLCVAIGCDINHDVTISTPDEMDTSEESRRRVTDEMIENGSDPEAAEAFTSELYDAQREWEAQQKWHEDYYGPRPE